MKWRRQASHLGRLTLWHNGRRATLLGSFILWHNGRRATQLGRFILWHNGHRASQLGRFILWHIGRRSRQLGRLTLWHQRPPKRLNDERFGRFSKHRSIVDPQQTLEICTLYQDSAKVQKMNALRRQNSRPQQTFER